MVPNFALSLSFEGIALLRQVNGAWASIAEVALDTPDLEAAVIALRDQARALDPDGGNVVLVIPNEQIRYLDAPDPGGDAAAREAAIRKALDGATPYAVDDLVHDYTPDRGRLLIAAVARETLDEAEAFARQHGFDGVSYAAIAPEDAFKGAVHFGKVKGWKGRVKRLPEAMRIVAADDAALQPVQQQPEPQPEPLPEPIAQPAEPETKAAEPVAPPAQKPEAAAEPAPQFDFATPEPQPEAEPSPDTHPEPAATEAEKPDPAPKDDAPPAAAASDVIAPPLTDADAGASFYFSTIRAALATDSLPPPPEAPRPEVKARFTPVAEPEQVDTVAPTPAPAPISATPPKPVHDGPRIAGIPAQPPGTKEMTARERAVALAARTPGSDKDEIPAPPLPGATERRFTPASSFDANLQSSAITSGRIEVGDDKPGRKGGAAGAAAAAMRFLSGRTQDVKDPALPKPAQPAAAPVPKVGLSALPKAPPAPHVLAPTPAVEAPKSVKIPAAPSDTVSAQALGKMAAQRSASLNKPLPEPEAVPAKDKQGRGALGRFAHLRRGKSDQAKPDKPKRGNPAKPSGSAAVLSTADEATRLTIFGARNQEIGGKPRFLGLMLTAVLLLFLAGVAAWASVFLQDGLASLFRSEPAPTEAVANLNDAAQPITGADAETAAALSPEDETDAEEDLQFAALETGSDAGQTAPALTQPDPPQALTPEQAAATYAATGIWQRAPTAPLTPPEDGVDQVYSASIDPSVQELDAIALPDPLSLAQQPNLDDPGLPPPAGMVFDFDERGLVRASPEGALTPEGLRIFTGLPPVVPPQRPQFNAPAADTDTGTQDGTATPDTPASTISRKRPEARPDDIIEQRERATQTGISKSELARLRPALRPQTKQEQAVVETPESPATELAVTASLVPVNRPRNIAAIVERSERRVEQQEVQTASAAAIAPRTVQPSGATGGSVAQAATVRNAINLGQVSLIGIYGTPSNRRALVRLPSGQYKKVKVGDSVDGGRVAAIGDTELRYVKSGRNVTLKMPRG